MAATRSWADLSSYLLVAIADAVGGGLGVYARLRSVCTAWRAALAPPFPGLLGLADGGRREPVRASIFSLPARRLFRLYIGSSELSYSLHDPRDMRPVHSRYASIVGSGSGRLAVAIHSRQRTERIFLLRPRTDEEAVLLPPSTADDERVRKVVFAPPGRNAWPTAVALYGHNKVAYIDAARRKEWTTVDIPSSKLVPVEQLVDLAFDAGGGSVYCLDRRGGVRVLRIPHGGGQDSEGPLLTPTPILLPSTVAPPYDVAISQNPTRHIFFCHGSLYTVWQTKRMYRDEIFVLRFDPERRPWWDAVKDLGGCSVFVAENSSPAVVRAGAGIPGVRADCVYWIRVGVPVAMVYDVATRTSEPYCDNKGNCWYFDDDHNVTISIDDKKQKRKRCSRS